jgi:hypothetical protein
MLMEEYRDAYMKGYVDGLAKGQAEAQEEKPFFTIEDIMKRYDCCQSKAGQILRAVRHVCNGGGLGTNDKVKKAELLYWETIVDKTFLRELKSTEAR